VHLTELTKLPYWCTQGCCWS